jgi:hypothetical protein
VVRESRSPEGGDRRRSTLLLAAEPRENVCMASPQTLSEADRRIVAVWAADCAERVLWLFEAVAGVFALRAYALHRDWTIATISPTNAGIRAPSARGRDDHRTDS